MPNVSVKEIYCKQAIDDDGIDLTSVAVRKFDRVSIAGPVTISTGQTIALNLSLAYNGQVADLEIWKGSAHHGALLGTHKVKSSFAGQGLKKAKFKISRIEDNHDDNKQGEYEINYEVI